VWRRRAHTQVMTPAGVEALHFVHDGVEALHRLGQQSSCAAKLNTETGASKTLPRGGDDPWHGNRHHRTDFCPFRDISARR
jgi:hypothetical protein